MVQQAVDQELVAVRIQALFAIRLGNKQVLLQTLRNDGNRKACRIGLARRFTLPEQFLQERDRFQQRRIVHASGKLKVGEQVPQVLRPALI